MLLIGNVQLAGGSKLRDKAQRTAVPPPPFVFALCISPSGILGLQTKGLSRFGPKLSLLPDYGHTYCSAIKALEYSLTCSVNELPVPRRIDRAARTAGPPAAPPRPP